MSKQIINIGKTPNDKGADPVRVAFNKVNSNFTELYNTVNNISVDLTEVAQDAAASMILNGSHKGLTVSYDDIGNKLNLVAVIDGGNAYSTY